MVYKKIIFCIVLISISVSLSLAQNFYKYQPKDVEDFRSIQNSKNEYFNTVPKAKGNGSKPFKRWQDFWEQRTYKDNSFPNTFSIYENFKKYKNKLNSNYNYKNWTSLGPSIVPKNILPYPSSGLGRISCMAVDPTDFRKLFAGAASGGLWVSTNEGNNWEPVNFVQFLSIGITDIAFSKSNPNIIYAATGDADGVALSRNYSLGVIKSTDGGKNWEIANLPYEYKNKIIITKIIVDPSNENKVFVATSNGLFYTEDGFATCSQISMNYCYIKDITFKPYNPSIMYSALADNSGWGIYKSTNKGIDWVCKLKLDSASRIAIGVTSLNANLVFAIAVNRYNGGFLGFYKSDDSGESWELVSNTPNILGTAGNGSLIGGQGNYDLCILPSMYNQNTVYIGGINQWKSNDYGNTWQIISHWSGENSVPFVHADHHDMLFSQTGKLYSCNDGGISISNDTGNTWTDISYGLNISQVYRLSSLSKDADNLICGTQDNGSLRCDGVAWTHFFGGDGTECFFNDNNKSKFYFSLNNGSVYFSNSNGVSTRLCINESDTKQKSSWITPIAPHPDSINFVYAGYYDVWMSKSTGAKDSWIKISNFDDEIYINHIAIAKSNPNVIYVSKQNKLYRTINGGSSWDKLYEGELYITYIAINENNPYNAWFTLSGYEENLKVMQINDNNYISNISGTLPNIPVNCVVYQPGTESILYIGTDIGVFWYSPLLYDWQLYGYSMPNVVISELDINTKAKKLFAGTFGRGVWKTDLVQLHSDSIKINYNNTQICYGDSTELSVNTSHIIKWSNGETTAAIFAKYSGQYFAIAVNDYGDLLISDTVNITVIDSLEYNVLSDKDRYCLGDTVRIYSNTNYKPITWNNSTTSDTLVITSNGSYFYTYKSENNCTINSDTINIEFGELSQKPNVSRIGNTLYAIVNDTIGITYNWYYNGSILPEHNDYFDIIEAGNYQVEICKAKCCNTSDIINIINSVDDKIATKHLRNITTYNKQVNINISQDCSYYQKYALYDISGKEIKEKFYSSDFYSPILNINNLDGGVYFLYIYCKDYIYIYKILSLD